MNEDEEVRRLTLDEIALLREVVKWRRAEHATFYLACSGRGWAGAGGFAEWRGRLNDQPHSVAWDRPSEGGFEQVGFSRDSRRLSYTYFTPESVTQVVDILVAYGFLPQRFSSAYRAGWSAAHQFTRVYSAEYEPSLLEMDAAMKSVPAVPATW